MGDPEPPDTVRIVDAAGKVLFKNTVADGRTKEVLTNFRVPHDPGLHKVTLPITDPGSRGRLLSDEFILTVTTENPKRPRFDFLPLSFFAEAERRIPNT